LRIVKVFWSLDASLAYQRHFPAINWLTSYSLYADSLADWYNNNVSKDWMKSRARFMSILHDEAELKEIVKLIGMDALSSKDRLKMETARSIREDFLHQLAFHEVDTYTSLKKQLYMMKLILNFNDEAANAVEKGADIESVANLAVREKIGRFKYVEEEKTDAEFEKLSVEISSELNDLLTKEED
ncbi:MAG: V-type ATP synthase subunit A, partial [Ruminococcus sp.]|nr:V-type ATP synthase subunit A [Ruminococcus sp.]